MQPKLIFALLLPALLAPAAYCQTATATPSDAAAAGATGLRAAEQSFLVEATTLGREASSVSRVAISQAASTPLRELAHQVVADYSQINSGLEALARRKGVMLPLQPTGASAAERSLETKTSATFDQAYLAEVSDTSARALRLFEATLTQARDPDVRAFAGSLLPVLRDHVNKTTELQKSL
jgi:putative membrane protein